MKCEDTYDRLLAEKDGMVAEYGQRQLAAHLESCESCRYAAEAVKTLHELGDHQAENPPADLFERVMQKIVRQPKPGMTASGFWAGAGVGSVLAASLVIAVIMVAREPVAPQAAALEQSWVAVGEPRDLHLAIDMERDLPGATITVLVSGGIELEGYESQRELTWQVDLEAGVNKLTLPVVAVNDLGGQLLVQVNHQSKQRTFRLDVKSTS